MRRSRKRLARVLLALCVVASVALWSQPASADGAVGCNQKWWPTKGAVTTSGSGVVTATFAFQLTPGELANLQCVAPYLEIDFRLEGVSAPPWWDNYIVASTNLPGAVHDVAVGDVDYANPGVTAINVRGENGLHAGTNYWVTLAWQQLPATPGQTPGFWIAWTPSHWAQHPVLEMPYCAVSPYDLWRGPAWCVFPFDGANEAGVDLRTNTIGINQLNFGGNSTHTFGNWVNSSPYVELLPILSLSFDLLPYLSMVGSIPDGFIIQSTDSNLYVAAGGRLFWFDKNNTRMLNAFRAQMQAKYSTTTYPLMAAAEVHAIEVNRNASGGSSPGSNMPADNTFMYEYGTTQQYVIKYEHPEEFGLPASAADEPPSVTDSNGLIITH